MAAARETTNAAQIPLRSVGAPAPAQLVDDLRALLDLPPQARERLWALLGPSISTSDAARTEREVEAFERAFDLPRSLLSRILRAYGMFVRTAALRGSPVEAVVDDLTRLTENPEPGRIVALGYRAAMALVRQEAMRAALLEHGAVLDGVDWRVDHVGASSRGDGLRFGFGALTLRYEDQGVKKRLTLQATPEQLVELEAACKAMIGRPAETTERPSPAPAGTDPEAREHGSDHR